MNIDQEPQPSLAERILFALILGALGFVTGIIAVSVFSDLPGIPLSSGAYWPVGLAAGAAGLIAGFLFADKTIEALGEVWGVLWKLSLGILSIIRSIVR